MHRCCQNIATALLDVDYAVPTSWQLRVLYILIVDCSKIHENNLNITEICLAIFTSHEMIFYVCLKLIQNLKLMFNIYIAHRWPVHDGCHKWNKSCLPFRSTRVHPRLLVGFVLHDIQFSFLGNVLKIVVCPFVLFLLAIVLSVLRFTAPDYSFGIFKLF